MYSNITNYILGLIAWFNDVNRYNLGQAKNLNIYLDLLLFALEAK